jgi:chorismate mutase
MEKELELQELRNKIDHLNEDIISGLKHRSRYSLNSSVFTKEFANNLSWFDYRLKAEQDIDSEFGRFLYPDQAPLVFNRNNLAKSKLARKVTPLKGLKALDLDLGKQIIAEYRGVLSKICPKGDNEEEYGEVVKLDVANVLSCNERIVGLGKLVAEYKLEHEPSILNAKTDSQILKFLVKPEREKEAIANGVSFAEKLNISNTKSIEEFMKELILLTRKAEIAYIRGVQIEKKILGK